MNERAVVARLGVSDTLRRGLGLDPTANHVYARPVGGHRNAECVVSGLLLLLATGVGLFASVVAWQSVGSLSPGFPLMANRLVGPGGGLERGGFRPLDVVVAIEGHPVRTADDVRAEIGHHPSGAMLRYTVRRAETQVEVEARTRRVTSRDFHWFLLDSLLPSLLVLAVGAAVVGLRPGTPECMLFLTFSLVSAVAGFGYTDLLTTHRLSRLTLAAWALEPAIFLHLALAFPERRGLVRRHPWIVWPAYALSATLGVWLEWVFLRRQAPAGEVVAAYWGLAIVAVVVSLGHTAFSRPPSLARQRARVLLVAFTVGWFLPIISTATEVVFQVTVPHLQGLWKLNVLFPVAIAYAAVRYQLFDVRTVVRAGTIYAVVTTLLAVAYAGLLTILNLWLSQLELNVPPLVNAAAVSLGIVVLVNPLYARTQRLLDRLFFPARHGAQLAVERLTSELTTALDLDRIAALIAETLDGLLRPSHVTLLLADEQRSRFRTPEGAPSRVVLPTESRLIAVLSRERSPLTRERVAEDPALTADRDGCLADMAALGADLLVPIVFHGRLAGVLVLGPHRGGVPYTSPDLRLVGHVANQSAVALENARAYHALEAALQRVQLLESIRSSLAKFVPRTVQDLIEEAPEAPALDKRQTDISVLFVDIAGYTRLSEWFDPARVNDLVERYFGAFLDEILAHGGDVNETAGDGLMVIFHDADPRRHAEAAVRAALGIVRRARAINAESNGGFPPVRVRLGVNSGVAAVGATKLEGAAGARWTYTASGPVTNVAARLATVGDGDSVVVGPETRRRLPERYAIRDLGEQRLRNVSDPLRVYCLTPDVDASQVTAD